MVYLVLIIIGLILGSFVNALVWRIHEQEERKSTKKKKSKQPSTNLSVINGRSVCPNCKHQLAAKDLVPLLSWLSLRGRCRYCNKSISAQYPLVELITALLFIISYKFWPEPVSGIQTALFVLWILLVTGFVALSVYDFKWFLLPNRIIYPVGVIASLFAIINVFNSDNFLKATLNLLFAILIGGGLFYLIYQLSRGKWIGGGDVRLGWILGALAGTPAKSLLFIFIASLLGTLVSLILLSIHKYKRNQLIPFGPFLMAGLFLVQLWGTHILDWYSSKILVL